MLIAQEVRMENMSARRVAEKFSEYEEAHKRMCALWLNVSNINKSNEQLGRSIIHKRKELERVKSELSENLDRIAANLKPKRAIKEIRAEIRSLEDEIDDKQEIRSRAERIAQEKQYGKPPENVNPGWYNNNKLRLAQSDRSTYAGMSCHVDSLRSEFLTMLFELKRKQFRKALGLNEQLIEQLKLLLAISPFDNLEKTMKAIFEYGIASLEVKTGGPEEILSFYKKGQ